MALCTCCLLPTQVPSGETLQVKVWDYDVMRCAGRATTTKTYLHVV